MPSRKGKVAFTLAEVLITLGIIGIVAAMTIPGLMTKINDKVNENRSSVIEKRLLQGLNMLNTQENGLSVHYDSTEDFVKALSKHLKITQICSKDELTKCFPYEDINYEAKGVTKQLKVSSLVTPAKIKLYDDGWLEPAGFITANGVPYIISFNNNCASKTQDNGKTVIDPDRPINSIPYQCLDGIYDINGTQSPNKMGKDVQSMHSASVYRCIQELGDFCILTKAFTPDAVSYNDCETKYKDTFGIMCYQPWNGQTKSYDPPSDNDKWLGAMIECQKTGGNLPTYAELKSLVSLFYKAADGSHPNISGNWESPCEDGSSSTNCSRLYTLDRNIMNDLNISIGGGMLYSSQSEGPYGAVGILFYYDKIYTGNIGRENPLAVCIGNQ